MKKFSPPPVPKIRFGTGKRGRIVSFAALLHRRGSLLTLILCRPGKAKKVFPTFPAKNIFYFSKPFPDGGFPPIQGMITMKGPYFFRMAVAQ
jgi:hypothetical protein